MSNEIEQRLGILAIDIYGLSEIMGPGVASDCEYKQGPAHRGRYVFLAEIIDPETLEPLPYGQEGELVITTIDKDGIPLIRYRTRDITSLHPDTCGCGRTLWRAWIRCWAAATTCSSSAASTYSRRRSRACWWRSRRCRRTTRSWWTAWTTPIRWRCRWRCPPSIFSDEVKRHGIAAQQDQGGDPFGAEHRRGTLRLVEPKTIARSEGKAKRVIDNRKL